MKRRRPRLCIVCHRPARWAVVYARRAARVALDGVVTRFMEPRALYACQEHVEAVEGRSA